MKIIYSFRLLLLISCISIALSSCDAELNRAFALARENKHELKKVIEYYKNDKEKLDAAKYLIRNSQYHTCQDTIDASRLSAKYLIENIDSAFDGWNNSYYLQSLSKKEFYESILPYKVYSGQCPDNWKSRLRVFEKKHLEKLNKIDAFKTDPYPVLEMLSGYLPKEYEQIPMKGCFGTSLLTMLYARANGLPAVMDFVPAWPKTNGYHCWNKCYGLTDKKMFKESTRYAKVYRKTFEPNHLLLEFKKEYGFIPENLSDEFNRDVTHEYTKTGVIKKKLYSKPRYAFLAVCNGGEWVIVDVCKTKGRYAIFNNVGLDVLYIILSIDPDMNYIPETHPFVFDLKGKINEIYTDAELPRTSIVMDRKFKTLSHVYSVLKTINSPIFLLGYNDRQDAADTVSMIPAEIALSGETSIFSEKSYRYYKLVTNSIPRQGLAEISFYDAKIQVLPNLGDRALFDSNLLSNYDVNITHPANFDFGMPVKLSKLLYYRRGDGNCVFPGNTYQLYWWSDKGWMLIDEKVAD